MEENFSPRVSDVITFSKEEALCVLATTILERSIYLLGILRDGEGTAIQILKDLGLGPKQYVSKIEQVLPRHTQQTLRLVVKILPLTRQAEKALKTHF